MSYYRLYFLGPDDRISRFVELFHDTDQQALDDAQGHLGGETLELWNQERFVARIPAEVGAAETAVLG
jgi:hypothetical protein